MSPRVAVAAQQAAADDSKQRVLFMCTHNSARSQMAEALLRHIAGDRFDVYSAGTEATGVRPKAIAVMNEIGIDISGQESKTLQRYLNEPWDYVITVCDDANESCPVFPGHGRSVALELPGSVQGDRQRSRSSSGVYRDVRNQIARASARLRQPRSRAGAAIS